MGVPNYCKDCKSYGTWKRYPDHDWKGINTKHIFEYAFICEKCGHTTLIPAYLYHQESVSNLAETQQESGDTGVKQALPTTPATPESIRKQLIADAIQ